MPCMHLNTYLFGLDDLISGFWEIGLRTMYDSKNKKQQDILSIEGFFLGLLQCLRLRRKGLLWIGCPCHSFTWMCSSKHQRTPATPLGNTNLDFVVQGNKVAARSILLALICMARGGFYFLEQPAGSALDVYPYMTFLCSLHRLDCHVRFPVGIMSAITFGSYAVVLLPRNCTCTGLMYVSRGGWDCLVIGLQNHQKGIPMCRGLSIEGTSYATGMTFLVISVSTFAKALGFPPPKSHHTRDPCADQKPSDRHEQSYVGKSCEGWKEDCVSCRRLSS